MESKSQAENSETGSNNIQQQARLEDFYEEVKEAKRRYQDVILCSLCKERKKKILFGCGHMACIACGDPFFLSHCHECGTYISTWFEAQPP